MKKTYSGLKYSIFCRNKSGELSSLIFKLYSSSSAIFSKERATVIQFKIKLESETPEEIKVEVKKAKSNAVELLKREIEIFKELNPELDFFLVRAKSKKCPVIFDYTDKEKYNSIKWSLKKD